ncbi:anti-sigma factor [uncultured Leifsonia sp.]|uniref:anti-sigma factor n=1 Tax=uncultured Leifsonia sp. TaxID=340359 RepID=UPI0025FF84BB|nr:anti-sigma factor [uncultured Leifsonia sp.]
MTDEERGIVDPERLGARLGAQTEREAREFEDVAAQLALSAEPVQPSAELKAALFAKLAETPQLPAENRSAAQEAVQPAADPPVQAVALRPVPSESSSEAAPPQPTPAEERARRRWFQRPGAILAAAAAGVILFVAGAFAGVSLSSTNSYQQQQAAALASINAAPDVQRATSPVAGGGTATLVWSAQLGRSALIATDLPELAGGKTYELWYIRDGAATPAGTMTATGAPATWRVLAGEMTAGDTVGVTVEPSGGSKQPTTKPIVAITS